MWIKAVDGKIYNLVQATSVELYDATGDVDDTKKYRAIIDNSIMDAEPPPAEKIAQRDADLFEFHVLARFGETPVVLYQCHGKEEAEEQFSTLFARLDAIELPIKKETPPHRRASSFSF